MEKEKEEEEEEEEEEERMRITLIKKLSPLRNCPLGRQREREKQAILPTRADALCSNGGRGRGRGGKNIFLSSSPPLFSSPPPPPPPPVGLGPNVGLDFFFL